MPKKKKKGRKKFYSHNNRYNQTVWKGWRESDGKTYPVTGSGGKKKHNN